ncbi:hypothetical protein T03_320 [Trichinella britovi]|uniref:Uncharacterized protein n=1 Tax=Trichinella britovi TaxID=45882 RepID=A0A0V1CGY7_TRIBR|nr:hypothetical protein T03_16443 [Trichinella britovi]KRY54513.1 hypothetical protein T03_320 [Trichinella britovi]
MIKNKSCLVQDTYMSTAVMLSVLDTQNESRAICLRQAICVYNRCYVSMGRSQPNDNKTSTACIVQPILSSRCSRQVRV